MIPWIKMVHVTAVSLSLTGFLLRGWWSWRAPFRLRHPLTRTLPHLNDTLLLTAGITMVLLYHWSLADNPWLIAKIIALLLYIGLGGAFFRAREPRLRAFLFFAAVFIFLYIVSVALTKQVWPIA